MALLRDEINSNLHEINIEIQALEKMISFYVDYEEKHGEWEYTTERLQLLNNRYAEYLIAGQIARDGVESPRIIGS
tara:strand:- start:3397 stop:3624 length:228 start_codon:yes stop_codon:yes gene_type:complete